MPVTGVIGPGHRERGATVLRPGSRSDGGEVVRAVTLAGRSPRATESAVAGSRVRLGRSADPFLDDDAPGPLVPGHREAPAASGAPRPQGRTAGANQDPTVRVRGVVIAGEIEPEPEVPARVLREPGAVAPLGGPGPVRSAPARMVRRAGPPAPAKALPIVGLNAPRYGYYEESLLTADPAEYATKFGDKEAVLADLVNLGVRYLRQPTNVDLTWPRVTDDRGNAHPAEIPAVTDFARAVELSELLHAASYDGLKELFERARDNGLQVVLTFLKVHPVPVMHYEYAFDPGTGREVATAVEASDPLEQLIQPHGIWWSADHSGQRVRWWDGSYPRFESVEELQATPTELTDDDWVYYSLDTRSHYKLFYVYLIARAMGRLLVEIDQAVGGDGIFPLIAGIELGNELNGLNMVDDAHAVGASARDYGRMAWLWALFVREATRGFQEALTEAGRSVPLWLPSLLSYASEQLAPRPDDVATLGAVYAFEEGLVSGLEAAFGRDPTFRSGALPGLSWFAGQDYHWYHYLDDTAPGPIARLGVELDRLRGILARSSGLAGVTMAVTESGASVESSKVAVRYLYASTVHGPGATADLFQAREVWRRLAFTLASGAHAGWHTGMCSSEDDTFAQMGLRHDDASDTLAIEIETGVGTAVASAVEPRLSYGAYQALAALTRLDLGGGPGRWTVVHPNPPGSSAGFSRAYSLDTTAPGDMAVILGFRVQVVPEHAGPSWLYWYVLLVDPSADPGLGVTFSASRPQRDVSVWATVPEAWSLVAAAASPERFSEYGATWRVPTSVSGRRIQLATSADADPILVLSPSRIEWVIS